MHLVATPRKTVLNFRLASMVLVLAGQLTAGCSQQPAPPPEASSQSPQSAQKVEPPQATLPDSFVIDLELAVTQQEVADGLMYRPSLPENRGMLFLFGNDRYPSFWMKNTLISLDLIFLDRTGRVVDVIAGVPPCAADPCPTYSPEKLSRAVLEIAAGAASAHGIEVGAAIVFDRVPGYPISGEQSSEASANS